MKVLKSKLGLALPALRSLGVGGSERSESKGFTLIELLISMGIIVIVGLVVYAFQKDVFFLNRNILGNLTSQNEARRTLKSMSAEIRTTSPSSLGAYAISSASGSSFVFYSNIDDDSFKERVRYFLDGTILKRGVLKPSGDPLTYNLANEVVTELIHDVVNNTVAVFNYYDANYDGTTQALVEPINTSAVRLVKITVLIDKYPQTLPGPINLTTQVSMRNLKDNL